MEFIAGVFPIWLIPVLFALPWVAAGFGWARRRREKARVRVEEQ